MLKAVLHKTRERGSMLPGSIDPPRRQFFGTEDGNELDCQIVADCFIVVFLVMQSDLGWEMTGLPACMSACR